MKIIRTPWEKDLMELVENAKKSIKIVSPFIKENVINQLILKKQSQTKIELITSFKFSNFCTGQSDLSVFNKIIQVGGKVKINSQLNANVYIFDDKKAIISSGNLSHNGLINNYEYGILVDDKTLILEIVSDYNAIAKKDKTRAVKKVEIELLEKIISQVFKANNFKKSKYTKNEIEIIRNTYDVVEVPIDSIRTVFQGWQLEVFNCINLTQYQIFTIEELNFFENHLKKLFPSQKNILDKIKIPLDYFIELGLILPFENEIYKKLWK
jgi:PLD-like domain/Dam-replacing HTH domain